MDKSKNSIFDITRSDLPKGVPALKMKRGIYYAPNNRGYTDNLLYAGLYSREEVISYCFSKNKKKNGKHGVYAVPLWLAIKQNHFSKKRIEEIRSRLDVVEKYVTEESIETILF